MLSSKTLKPEVSFCSFILYFSCVNKLKNPAVWDVVCDKSLEFMIQSYLSGQDRLNACIVFEVERVLTAKLHSMVNAVERRKEIIATIHEKLLTDYMDPFDANLAGVAFRNLLGMMKLSGSMPRSLLNSLKDFSMRHFPRLNSDAMSNLCYLMVLLSQTEGAKTKLTFPEAEDIWRSVIDAHGQIFIIHCLNSIVTYLEPEEVSGFVFSSIIKRILQLRASNVEIHVHSGMVLNLLTKLKPNSNDVDRLDLESIENYLWLMTGTGMVEGRTKHNIRKILVQLVLLYRVKFEDQFRNLTQKALEMSWEVKTKVLILKAVLEGGKGQAVELIVALVSNIQNEILDQLDLPNVWDSGCSEIYEKLMQFDRNLEVDPKMWMQTWVNPILKIPLRLFNNLTIPSIANLLDKADGLSKGEVFDDIIAKLYEAGDNDDEVLLTLGLIVMKKQKLSLNNRTLGLAALNVGLHHFSEEIRILAFDVIVTSRSSAESYLDEELESILDVWPLNVSINSPAVRQSFIHLLKKVISNCIMKSSFFTFHFTNFYFTFRCWRE